MKLNKQNKIIVGVLAFLLTLTVGYAVFSQSLNITGTAKAEGNFSLIFSSVGEIKQVGSTGATATRENSNKTLSVNVPNLQYPTAYVEIPAEIKNEGSINAQLESITTEGLTEDDIKVTYKLLKDEKEINLEENNDVIESGKTRDIIITVTWDENSTKNEVTLEKFTIYLNYEQYTKSIVDNETTEKKECTQFTKKDTYSVGDVIAFCNTNTGKSEDFYVISDNGTTVAALAKYNLMVGYSYDTVTGEKELIPENKEDYGLQSDKTLVDEKNEMTVSTEYGLIHFANANENHKDSDENYLGYWADSNGNLLNDYKKTDTSTYPIDVYDNNSNLYIPLQNYKEYLENLNVSINEIRPITYAELIDLGCNTSSCATEETSILKDKETQRKWLFEGYNYWTSTAHFYLVKVVDGTWLDNPGFAEGVGSGLRPVIEINKSEI